LFPEAVDLLAVTLLCHLAVLRFSRQKKETTTFPHRFPEGRGPNCHCSVALGTFRESESGKTKGDVDPNDTIVSLCDGPGMCSPQKKHPASHGVWT